MFKLIATAPIYRISEAVQVPNSTLVKRELILAETYTKDGQDFSNFVCIEFLGDRMSLLDNFMPGQRVTVEAMVKGRETRDGRFFNSISGLSIVHFQPQQPVNGVRQAPMQAAPQQGYQAPTGMAVGVPQQYAYQPLPAPTPNYQQAQYQQTLEASRRPYGQQPSGPGMADLPFPS